MVYFITGNKHKFDEVKSILPFVEQLDIDLPEIQGIDARQIVEYKLREALHHKSGRFIVEDTSLYLECLKGLPGPLIKWFLQTIGNEGLVDLAEKLGNRRAEAKTIIGYAENHHQVYFFEGAVRGEIISPRGEEGFSWDLIFKPDGHDKTFGEMSRAEKNELSMRRVAVNHLSEFLNSR